MINVEKIRINSRKEAASFERGEHFNNIQALQTILETRQVTALFQPIVSLKQNIIHGFEALSRGPSDSPLHAPLKLFDVATRNGQLTELEILCRQVSLEACFQLALPGKLFLNASPACLMQPKFRRGKTLEYMSSLGISADKVVIELTEHTAMHDYQLLRDAVAHYRSMGFEIAIDDLGAGYAGLRLWSELRPDYVKIDMYFVQGIHEDRCKRQFVHSIQEIALSLNCKVIAEGIETKDEYLAINDLGIDFGQGYYFARPNACPSTTLASDIILMDYANSIKSLDAKRSQTASAIIIDRHAVDLHTPVEDVGNMLYNKPSLNSIPVVEAGKPVGLVRRTPFIQMFASLYGRSLHGKKLVLEFMDRNPLIVDKNLPLEKLSKLVTMEAELNIADDFIITENGRYAGVGTVMKLLQKITDLQIRNARYANPLTMMSGTVPLNERLDTLLQEDISFTICYFDLDSFKPFNDAYGYNKGDEAIKMLAQIIAESSNKESDFVAHIGGDDFITIFISKDWEERCQAILARFESEIPQFYDKQHIMRGGLWSKDRRNKKTFYPVMSLSIGAVEILPKNFNSHYDIASMASNAKAMAKKINGNALFVDRRQQKLLEYP